MAISRDDAAGVEGGTTMTTDYDAAQELAARAATHGIVVSEPRGDGFHSQDGWEHHRFRFDVTINGEPILMNAVYRQGLGIYRDPAPGDALAAVLLDFGSIEGCDDWLDWVEEFGMEADAKSLRKARSDFEEIAARRTLFIEHGVSEDALRELYALASEL